MGDQHFSYGGQAVLEGVMMRGQRQATVAVRQPDGAIAFKHFALDKKKRDRWEGVPLLRGVVLLWDMLNLGTKALHFSVSAATGEEEELSKSSSVGAILLALVIAIGLFFVLPLVLATIAGAFGATLLFREVLESLLRLGLIIGYIVAIGRIPEIKRLFGYHGAEHKAVNAYEAGKPLNVEAVKQCSVIHPRCGTSFLIVVVLISFVLFLFLGGLPFWAKVLSRVVLVPVIAAVAYELIRLSAAHYHRPWVRTLIAPSLRFQQFTTREPDEHMIATAIAALNNVLAADGKTHPIKSSSEEVLVASPVG